MSNKPLRWRHHDHDSVSNHQPHGCLLNRLFRRKSKKTSKLRVTGLCAGNSPGPVNSPHKGPVTRKMYPFDDVIMPIWQRPQCIIQNRNVHISVLNGALWYMGQVHCGICEIGLLHHTVLCGAITYPCHTSVGLSLVSKREAIQSIWHLVNTLAAYQIDTMG